MYSRGRLLASLARYENAVLLKIITTRRWVRWCSRQVLTGIVDEAARTHIGASIAQIRNKAARVSLPIPGVTADTAGCRIDRMRRSLQETVEVIPSQGTDEACGSPKLRLARSFLL
jgi:hypothetical protein